MGYGIYGMGYGLPDNHLDFFDIEVNGGVILVRFRPATQSPARGDEYFGIYRNAKLVDTIYAKANEITERISVLPEPGHSIQTIVILSHGFLADPAFSQPELARIVEQNESGRVTLRWIWQVHEVGSYDDTNDYATNWALSGLTYDQARRVTGYPTRGELDYDIAVSGGNATVTLRNGTQTLATGTGAVGTTVTLAEANSSGITGTVDIDAGAVTTSNLHLYLRWPESMKILRDTSDPPSTLITTVAFNKLNEGAFTEAADLAAGTYYYRIQPVSDTGDDGTVSDTLTAAVPGVPDSPGDPEYVSGNYNNTVISWEESTTPGATYNVYVQQVGETMNKNDPTQTLVTGSDQTTLPTMTYPGKAYVLVRALNGGVESRNGAFFELEYDSAGNYVAKRPNTPTLDAWSQDVSSGRSLTISCTYDTSFEAAEATQVQLFVRTLTGSYDYASPVNTQSLGNAINNVKQATLSYTFPANGLYWITAKAATAGGVQSENPATELLVYVSDADIDKPTNIEVIVARG